jgi:hypothetical protein
MKKIVKRFMFAFVGLSAVVALASCGHSHKYSWESDNTKHRQVCEECDEKTEYEAHVWGDWVVKKEPTLDEKGSREHTCTECGKTVAEDTDEKKPALGALTADWNAVYVQAPADWEEVYIHYFNNDDATAIDEKYTSVWPGYLMTLVDETKHLYGYQVPKGVSGLVIHNNAGVQTVDVVTSTERNLYVLGEADGDGKITFTYKAYTPTANDPELGKPEEVTIERVTIYAQLPASWNKHMIHYWGVAATTWPGEELTLVDAEQNLYKIDGLASTSGFIFNDGNPDGESPDCMKTGNLSIPEGVNAFIVSEDDPKAVSYAKYENGVMTPVELGLPEAWLVGSLTNWDFTDEANKLVADPVAKKSTLTVFIPEGAEFKVCDTTWGNEAAFSYEGQTAFAPVETGTNIKCVTSGIYVLTVDFSDTTPVLTIVPYNVYCVGEHTNWGDGFVDANKLTISEDGLSATITVTLEANDEFQICDATWGHKVTLVENENFSGGTGGANVKCLTAGTYVLTVSDLLTNPTLTITTPAA